MEPLPEIDATGLLCPLPVLRARKALAGLAPGRALRLIADDPAALVDVPHFCASEGHGIEGPEELGGERRVWTIRRGEPPVFCLGAAAWDTIAWAGGPLAPGADVPGAILRRPGGVALNVALALAGLGLRPALLSAVGRDAAGDALMAEAEGRGVDCRRVLRVAGPTDRYVAIEGADGEVFAAVADCAALERAASEVLEAAPDGDGRVVVDGNLPDAVLAEIGSGRALAEKSVAFVVASPGKAARLAAAGGRGAIYLNRREAEAVCGAGFADSRAAARALRARGFVEAVVTDGRSAACHAGPEGEAIRTPPEASARSVTGAGDVFLAAHLAAGLRGAEAGAALEAALRAAADHVMREVG